MALLEWEVVSFCGTCSREGAAVVEETRAAGGGWSEPVAKGRRLEAKLEISENLSGG